MSIPMFRSFAFSSLLLFGITATASAEEPAPSRPIILIDSQVTVHSGQITLGDIAKVTAADPALAGLVADLKKISLGDAPLPNTQDGISGRRILDAIQAAGISPDSCGYSIPQTVQVERAGRVLAPIDVLGQVRESLKTDQHLDIQVREITWDRAQSIPIGKSTVVKAEPVGEPVAGKLPLRVSVFVDNAPAAKFMASAIVDDWRNVPVLTRNLDRGMLIGPESIELVRLNLFKQPPDVADTAEAVVGRRAKTRLAAGDTIRKSMVDIPPLIAQGKRITMAYNGGGVKATASGIAVDNGLEGDIIRVKNENSHRLIKGRVKNENEVEVVAE